MDLIEMMDRDLAAAHATLGQRVSLGTASVPCIFSDLRTGGAAEFEYMAPTADVEIRIRVAEVAGWTPARGAQVELAGDRLEIEAFTKTANRLEWVLLCRADRRRG